MPARPLHRFIGLVMLLPFAAWAVTGAIFFIKPGYGGAYDALAVKTYPLNRIAIEGDAAWLEARVLETVLGGHLLVRTAEGWQHLDPSTRQPKPPPDADAVRRLITDAIAANPSRYGAIATVDGLGATTTTNARVTLNWARLSLAQRGTDTDRIDAIYRIHYLQWTGVEMLDRAIGGLGLVLIVVLSALGARLAFRRR